jgi:hypothetical protein
VRFAQDYDHLRKVLIICAMQKLKTKKVGGDHFPDGASMYDDQAEINPTLRFSKSAINLISVEKLYCLVTNDLPQFFHTIDHPHSSL